MAQKPKARGAPNKAGATAKQKAQSERFIKAAREIGVDETGKSFERTIKKIVRAKPSPEK
ncbi:MAG: hypothetical protein KJZ73_05505 [Pseudorhodoplanes sp.]|nr:hypothetical protein [Pseudorhodoplanes sp.]GIK82302.1 MAG: hypothetical protein BroJett024_34070 [Alphaproteobacteria bacterium]